MHELAAGGLGFTDHLRHFWIVVIEDLVKQEGGALVRTEALENREESHRDLASDLGLRFGRRSVVLDHGLRQPGPGVLSALLLQVPQAVQAQASGDGYQKTNG